jgi:hypothetical protein
MPAAAAAVGAELIAEIALDDPWRGGVYGGPGRKTPTADALDGTSGVYHPIEQTTAEGE